MLLIRVTLNFQLWSFFFSFCRPVIMLKSSDRTLWCFEYLNYFRHFCVLQFDNIPNENPTVFQTCGEGPQCSAPISSPPVRGQWGTEGQVPVPAMRTCAGGRRTGLNLTSQTRKQTSGIFSRFQSSFGVLITFRVLVAFRHSGASHFSIRTIKSDENLQNQATSFWRWQFLAWFYQLSTG